MVEFNIKDRKLTIDPATLTVSAFNDIWEHDVSKTKTKASNMLTYVFHMRDITQKNPFKDLQEVQKDAFAKRNSFGDQDYKFAPKEQELISRAMAWYEELNKDSVLRLSMVLNKKLDEITTYFEKTPISSAEEMEDQIKSMASIEKILISKKKTDDFVAQQMEKTKLKGAQALSPLQGGLLKKGGKE